jgi:hypothetical protein
MSKLLFGVISHNLDSSYADKEIAKIFDRYLYDIHKIGIDNEISIAMGGKISGEMLDDIRLNTPKYLTGKKIEITITKSPLDNVSDDLFNEWEYEAAQENYRPGNNKVFNQLEKFFENVLQMINTQSIWIRYESISDYEIIKLSSYKNLESQIYTTYIDCGYQIPDFEIYFEKSLQYA